MTRSRHANAAFKRPTSELTVLPATATAADWQRVVDVLATTAQQRDGDAAARHAEIRQRMRALARAARSLARSL